MYRIVATSACFKPFGFEYYIAVNNGGTIKLFPKDTHDQQGWSAKTERDVIDALYRLQAVHKNYYFRIQKKELIEQWV